MTHLKKIPYGVGGKSDRLLAATGGKTSGYWRPTGGKTSGYWWCELAINLLLNK